MALKTNLYQKIEEQNQRNKGQVPIQPDEQKNTRSGKQKTMKEGNHKLIGDETKVKIYDIEAVA